MKNIPWNKGKRQFDCIADTLKYKWKQNNTTICPDCKNIITHKTYSGYRMFVTGKTKYCRKCSSKGSRNGWFGAKRDDHYKKDMAKKLSGENNPMYGKIGKNHPAFGYKHTPETKLKISISKKGKPMSASHHQNYLDACYNSREYIFPDGRAAKIQGYEDKTILYHHRWTVEI